MNKKLISFFLIYFVQLVASSCDPCSCEIAKTFERSYVGLIVKAWDTSGFNEVEVTGTVHKNSFGLTISVDFELKQIATHFKSGLNFKSFGFTSAYACSCAPDKYINVDPIDSIIIEVTNTQTQEITDITENFTTKGYNGEQITISELFKNKAEWHDGFQVDLSKYDNIPDTSIFKVIISLKSGTELIEETEEINFE